MSAPPEVIFFTDRDLDRLIPLTMREAGVAVEMHDDHFAELAQDVEWIPLWLSAVG